MAEQLAEIEAEEEAARKDVGLFMESEMLECVMMSVAEEEVTRAGGIMPSPWMMVMPNRMMN
jgi:hypothetical protein